MHYQTKIFFPPSLWQYILLLALIAVYLTTALLHAIGNAWIPVACLSIALLIKYLVLFAPFALRPAKYGLLHPLTFPAIWIFLNDVVRKSSAYFDGLAGHSELPGLGPSGATYLMAYYELLTGLAAACTILGYLATPNIKAQLKLRLAPTDLSLKSALLLIVSSIAFYIWMKANGGMSGLLLQRAMPHAERLSTSMGGHYVVLSQLFGFVIITVLAYRPKYFCSPLYWTLAITGMGINYLSNGSRGSVIYLLCMILMVYVICTRRIPYPLLLIGATASVFLLGFLSIFRTSHYGERQLDVASLQEISVGSALEEGMRDASTRAVDRSGALPILARVGLDSPLLLGRSYISIPTAPIPSAILPFEKPPTAAPLNGKTFFNTQAGVPPGPIAEAYWNFHVIGIVIIYFLWGSILKLVAGLVLSNSDMPGVLAAYVVFIFTANPGSDATFQFTQAVGMVGLCCFFFSLRLFRSKDSQPTFDHIG